MIADLQRAIERALALGVRWDDLIVDPGFGFGKTATHNLELMRDFGALTMLGRPILLGASRKSTLGRVLDLPVGERLEATLATTALGIAGGADLVRVHDVQANVRAARMSDAIVRGTWQPDAGRRPDLSDKIVLANMQFQGRHGYYDYEMLNPQPFEVDVELRLNLQPAGVDDDLEKSVDYGKVYAAVRQIVESTSYRLLEALAEAISPRAPRRLRGEPRSRSACASPRSSSAGRSTTRASRSAGGAPRTRLTTGPARPMRAARTAASAASVSG